MMLTEETFRSTSASCNSSWFTFVALILSSTEVAGIHASIMVLCWVGIPLLRFHPHPSRRRSIGQTIGVTAYPPQRAATFTIFTTKVGSLRSPHYGQVQWRTMWIPVFQLCRDQQVLYELGSCYPLRWRLSESQASIRSV